MKLQPIFVKAPDVTPLDVLGAQVRFLCEGRATGNAWSMMEVTLTEGAGPPLHTHGWDEAYCITAGEIESTVGERRFVATAGDFVYTPAGVPHGFSGVSKQPARVLIFDVPAHAGNFFKRVDREVKELPRELPKVLAIGRETGIHFLEPA
jgi:quercetin dioxygenase-like cupin family protein